MRKAPAIVLIAAALLVVGCGEDDDSADGPVPAPPAPEHTEREVRRQLNIVTDDVGLDTHKPSGCGISVIMIGREQVDMYVEAGDTVASNPDRTVGLKIFDTNDRIQKCHAALTKALADL